jgi:hypothetical protein
MNPASAKTSLNQIPSLHKKILAIHQNATIFDFGAGKRGKVDDFADLNAKGYFPFDPFHRSVKENHRALLECQNCDFVLCANVLNVIEDEHLQEAISQLSQIVCYTKQRRMFLSVYHNPKLAANRQVGEHFQRNLPLVWYIEKIKPWFSSVTRMNDVLACHA